MVRLPSSRLVLVALAAVTLSCKRTPTPAQRDPAASDVAVDAPRTLLLGKIVNLRDRRAERTLASPPPELEKDDGRSAFYIDADGTLRAIRMNDGSRLWSAKPPESCNSISLDDDDVYCTTEHALWAYPKDGTSASELRRTTASVRRIALGKATIAIAESDGRLTLVDRISGGAASAIVRAACPSWDVLQFRAGGDAICVSDCGGTACYDAKLTELWSLPKRVDESLRYFTPSELLLVAYRLEQGKSKDTVVTPMTARVVRLADGTTAWEGHDLAMAFTETKAGELDGVVTPNGLVESDGHTRWPFQIDFFWMYFTPPEVTAHAGSWLLVSDVESRVWGIDPSKRAMWSTRLIDEQVYEALEGNGNQVDFLDRFETRDRALVVDARVSSTETSAVHRRIGAVFDAATGARVYLDVAK
jgi:hypothetical protein